MFQQQRERTSLLRLVHQTRLMHVVSRLTRRAKIQLIPSKVAKRFFLGLESGSLKAEAWRTRATWHQYTLDFLKKVPFDGELAVLSNMSVWKSHIDARSLFDITNRSTSLFGRSGRDRTPRGTMAFHWWSLRTYSQPPKYQLAFHSRCRPPTVPENGTSE